MLETLTVHKYAMAGKVDYYTSDQGEFPQKWEARCSPRWIVNPDNTRLRDPLHSIQLWVQLPSD